MAVAGLNFLLGAVHTRGGVMPREEAPQPRNWSQGTLAAHASIEDLPDHSIAVLILGDSPSGDALPWPLIAKKLIPEHNIVVSLAPFVEGGARRADYILPSPAFLETLEEVPTPPTATFASLSIAAPLIPAPKGAVEAAVVLSKLGGAELNFKTALEERVAAIHEAKSGTVTDVTGTKSVGEFKTSDELFQALLAGATWTANPPSAKPLLHYDLTGEPAVAKRLLALIHPRTPPDIAFPLTLLPYAWRGASGSSVLPPLFTKVYQESRLRGSASQCRMHPQQRPQQVYGMVKE